MDKEHHPGFLTLQEADWLYNQLLVNIPWRQVKYYKPERGLVTTPRLTWCCGFHQDTHYQLHLPTPVNPQPIPRWLFPLKKEVETRTKSFYNFILFSYYRNGLDSIAYHSDDERFLGNKPTISSITIGFPRSFYLKDKATKEVTKYLLGHGDLFLMQNNCQKKYLHSVPKMMNHEFPRISLTFRKVLNEEGSTNYYKYNYLEKPF